mgnify:CR=1 FL=1
MRILRFIVNNDVITRDPLCDFNGLFPGANSDVYAEFEFSEDWNDRVKVASFWSMMGAEYPPQALDYDNMCEIPKEALAKPAFKVQVFGKDRKRTVQTNAVTVYQRGGAK